MPEITSERLEEIWRVLGPLIRETEQESRLSGFYAGYARAIFDLSERAARLKDVSGCREQWSSLVMAIDYLDKKRRSGLRDGDDA